MKPDEPHTIYLKDYAPPAYLVDTVHLSFELDPDRTIVKSAMTLHRNPLTEAAQPLRLDGEQLDLVSVRLDGNDLEPDGFAQDETGLSIFQVPERFTLDIETIISPSRNTALEGLYLSKSMFCTQCEAQGFRKITYFPDRPDVMAVYTTKITAPADKNPVFLSNGNLTAKGTLRDGRHWAEWHDPFPKPSYLFAVVAGNLACCEDVFTTMSGRTVTLRLFVEPGDQSKCDYALDALKRAMRWDENVYGREYDLDIFMIVAVSHFNMGAMENKGLNVFNSQYILAQPETATDQDYENIEAIIAHEYFHNWTGNRITCRDWFQLCLKEGLTVFRDQQFSADMRSQAVQRIKDVRTLRTRQFPEDSGPLSHPVRPDAYMEINNFYTATVYEKGAEIVRMLHTMLGAPTFRKATDLYFERHDGQAATVEDFVKVMEDVSGLDLGQFRLWYSQAGTPQLHITSHYDVDAKRFELRILQSCAPTPGQEKKSAFHIPLAIGLIDRSGKDLPIYLDQAATPSPGNLLHIKDQDHVFVFENIPDRPVVSLLRHFSAPVKVDYEQSQEEQLFLMAHDSDAFNRWEAGRRYAEVLILRHMAAAKTGAELPPDDAYHASLRRIVTDPSLDPYFVAQALTLPGEIELAQAVDVIDPDALHRARQTVERHLTTALADDLMAIYRKCQVRETYSPDSQQAGKRALRNRALTLLSCLETDQTVELAVDHFRQATNMTDSMSGLAALVDLERPERDAALADFYDRWQTDNLVVNKWLMIQAISHHSQTIERVTALTQHDCFDRRNPNRVRALIGAFAHNNQLRFHHASGTGYVLVANMVRQLDSANPQVAARLLNSFENWRRFDSARQTLMHGQLKAVLAHEDISKNVFEIATKILN